GLAGVPEPPAPTPIRWSQATSAPHTTHALPATVKSPSTDALYLGSRSLPPPDTVTVAGGSACAAIGTSVPVTSSASAAGTSARRRAWDVVIWVSPRSRSSVTRPRTPQGRRHAED